MFSNILNKFVILYIPWSSVFKVRFLIIFMNYKNVAQEWNKRVPCVKGHISDFTEESFKLLLDKER